MDAHQPKKLQWWYIAKKRETVGGGKLFFDMADYHHTYYRNDWETKLMKSIEENRIKFQNWLDWKCRVYKASDYSDYFKVNLCALIAAIVHVPEIIWMIMKPYQSDLIIKPHPQLFIFCEEYSPLRAVFYFIRSFGLNIMLLLGPQHDILFQQPALRVIRFW